MHSKSWRITRTSSFYLVAKRHILCDLFLILMLNGTVRMALLAMALVTGLAQENGNKPETLARWHFAGLEKLRQLENQKPLQQMLELPQTAALRQAGLSELGRKAAAQYSRGSAPEAQRQIAAITQQLLGDLLEFESKFQLTGSAAGADWVVAVKLKEARAAEWKKEIATLAQQSGMTIAEGPEWSASRGNYKISFSKQKDWTVLSGGATQDSASLVEFRNGLDNKLGKLVLDADLNFPRLGEHLNARRLGHAPRMAVQSSPNGDGFRSEIILDLQRPLEVKPEKWSVPTELIRDPLVGFTAIQGVRELLSGSPWFKSLGARETPNQLFTWSLDESPFSSYLAARVGNPPEVVTNVLQNLVAQIQQRHTNLFFGQAQYTSNRTAVIWRGLPVIVPFVEAATGASSEFLVAGLFPVAGKTNQAPGELFAQLNKKNLIYYEWEITEGRLRQLRPITQLIQIVGTPNALRGDAPSGRWIDAIAPKLGNTITEGTLEGDRRIRVVRQSHMGLNSLELVLLAHWLDPNDFRSPGSLDNNSRGKNNTP